MTNDEGFNLIVTLCRHAQMEGRRKVQLQAFSRIRRIAEKLVEEALARRDGGQAGA